MRGIQMGLVAAIRDNPGITSIQASQLAGAGDPKNTTALKKKGYIKAVGTKMAPNRAGKPTCMDVFEVTETGRMYCDGKYYAPRSGAAYRPREREPHEALSVQFAPMHQPTYVPPRWESVR
jgi:hypothetical protein